MRRKDVSFAFGEAWSAFQHEKGLIVGEENFLT